MLRVRARVDLIPTDRGGKLRAVGDGFSPQHNFGGARDTKMYRGDFRFPEGVELRPGESAEIVIAFFDDLPELRAFLTPGCQWRIQEALKLVGTGTVLEVLE